MDSSAQQRMPKPYDPALGSGWTVFAAVIFLVHGVFYVVDGFAAIFNSHYFTDDGLFANLDFWGVVWIILGCLAIYTFYALLSGLESGRIIGIFLASLSLFTQLLFIYGNPWSLVVIAIDLVLLYALIVKTEPTEPGQPAVA